LALGDISMAKLITSIIDPELSLNISKYEVHLFQIFAAVTCDLLWFTHNKVIHDNLYPDAISIARQIKKTSLELLEEDSQTVVLALNNRNLTLD
jgi:hypothetical protein